MTTAAWSGPIDDLTTDGGQLGGITELTFSDAADPAGPTLVPGGTFILDGDTTLVARWGSGSDVLWANGESLLLAAPTGVGKTTLAVQLVEALIGVGTGTVLGLPVMPARRVLYLAMDRPRQITRAMRRRLAHVERATLDERLVVLKGPMPADVSKVPDQFITLARRAGADVVVVDSLKDACAKLTDDESGSMVNRAVQYCNAADVDVLVLHHQRKGVAGSKPTKLEDVYGSTWITAGAGSVVLLWGEAGSEVVELTHLKQPADPVGPWTVEHDHTCGLSKVQHGFDALAYLNHNPGASVSDAARAEHGATVKAGSKEWKRTERRLKRLVHDGYAECSPQLIVGAETRYRAVDNPRGHTEVTDPFPHHVDTA